MRLISAAYPSKEVAAQVSWARDGFAVLPGCADCKRVIIKNHTVRLSITRGMTGNAVCSFVFNAWNVNHFEARVRDFVKCPVAKDFQKRFMVDYNKEPRTK